MVNLFEGKFFTDSSISNAANLTDRHQVEPADTQLDEGCICGFVYLYIDSQASDTSGTMSERANRISRMSHHFGERKRRSVRIRSHLAWYDAADLLPTSNFLQNGEERKEEGGKKIEAICKIA
jgi:hypothetical protein